MSRYVNTFFSHRSNCSRIDTVCFYARTVDLRFFSGKMSQVPFGNLAAAAIAGTEDEDFFHDKNIVVREKN